MEQIKKQILELLDKNSVNETSSTGITGEIILYAPYNDIVDDIIKIFENSQNNFDKSVEPAIRYLFKNHNPHTKIYIDYNTAELLQGQKCHDLNNEIPD